MNAVSVRLVCLITAASLAIAFAAPADESSELGRIEDAYADMNDALGAVGLIDSGSVASHGEFLGRPVSPDALIADIARISDE